MIYGFDLYFPEHLFMHLLAIFMSLEKMSIQVICQFFNQVVYLFLLLRCQSFLYFLDIYSISDICSTDILLTLLAGVAFAESLGRSNYLWNASRAGAGS